MLLLEKRLSRRTGTLLLAVRFSTIRDSLVRITCLHPSSFRHTMQVERKVM
jgi:hypothetical protein